ncbi:hypothetical protein PSTT_05611, partial [Puccinia striiformis]
MKSVVATPQPPSHPLIKDIWGVVQPPFTQELPVPHGVPSAPNALQLVRHIGGCFPVLPDSPYYFSIPGNTLFEAQVFVKAMCQTIRWNLNRHTLHDNDTGTVSRLHHFKLEFRCPCHGLSKTTFQSHKKITSPVAVVEWNWMHNHDRNSLDDMLVTRVPEAVDRWLKDCRKWATLVDIQDSKSFLFAFQSVWQKKMMQNHRGGMLMIDATHNTVANNFMEGKLKISLYTVMLHDPIVGKGLPVAWAFTLAESHEPVRRLLSWLQDTSGSRLQSVMSDCALAIANAVAHTFPPLSGDCTKHYWCLFHVFKAFKAKAKTLLPGRADEAYQAFRKIVYSPLDPNLSLISFWLRWREVSPVFGSYVWKQWIWRLTHWSMFFQTTAHQGVHTNPYTEAWHRVLKDEYIRPRACKRIDEVLHILIHEIEPKYRWSQLQVANGFVGQTIN